MKYVTCKLLAVAASVGLVSTAMADTVYVAADRSVLTKLCVSAAMDSKERFRVNMNRSRLSHRYIETNIACNGVLLADFAREAGNFPNFYMLNPDKATRIDIYQTSQSTDTEEDRIVYVSAK